MIIKQYKIAVLFLLAFAITATSFGQNSSINLEEALSIARKNYSGLERDKLIIEQQTKLSESGIPFESAQLYFSGDELGVNGQTGIHSFNFQQNFNLPKASRVQKTFHQQGAILAEKQLALTDFELKRQVEMSYYQLLYAKQDVEIVTENLSLYDGFLSVTTTQLESGEAGKIPQLAARTYLGQTKLELEHSRERYQIALTLFNIWLQSDTLYEAEGNLPNAYVTLTDSSLQNNAHLEIIKAQKEIANAKVAIEKAKLLPQINSGLKLQTASGNFPLFGYQAGINVPLFRKAYKNRIEAAEVGVLVQEADFKTKEQELSATISELLYSIEHQQHIIKYLQDDLTPLMEEQSDINLMAYKEGEIGYLEYLDGLEQAIKVKQQYLSALYKFHALSVDLSYWVGK